jgi:hypothetical protein
MQGRQQVHAVTMVADASEVSLLRCTGGELGTCAQLANSLK